MKLIFPKPHPLSPNNPTQTILDSSGKYWITDKSRQTSRKFKRKVRASSGVGVTDSVYYWWFEYLKRNEEYKKVCESNGKDGTDEIKHIYADFGDIYSYCQNDTQFSNVKDFWKWWKDGRGNKRGMGVYLFAYKPLIVEPQFLSYGDVKAYKNEIESGKIKLIAIQTNQSKNKIRSDIGQLLKELETTEFEETKNSENTPLYQPSGSSIDVERLRRDIEMWDAFHGFGNIDKQNLVDIYLHHHRLDSERNKKLLKMNFKGYNNYLYGLELDEEILETKFGWLNYKLEDSEDGEEAEEKCPKELMEQITTIQNKVFKSFAKQLKGDEDRASDVSFMYACHKLGMTKRTKDYIDAKKLRNTINATISRAVKRAQMNIDATGKGKFNIGMEK